MSNSLQILSAIEKQLRKSPTLAEILRNPNWRWYELRSALQNETIELDKLRRALQVVMPEAK